jgi:uncharacterized lipoprotein YmbA
MTKQKNPSIEVRAEVLTSRLFSLLEMKQKGAKVDSLISATENLLDRYAKTLLDKDVVIFIVEDEY